jgi:hypothetical protein
MGVRLYNPGTGRFLQPDPVPGGSAGPYLYPTNPIDGYDLNGQWWNWLKKVAHVVHKVVSNPWVQSAVTVAACSTGVGCGLAVWSFTALNAYDRHNRYGWGTRFWAGTLLDVGLSRLPLRNLRNFREAPDVSVRFPLFNSNRSELLRQSRNRLIRRNLLYGSLAVARSNLLDF